MTCGCLIGHLAIPGNGRAASHLPIRCSRPAGHVGYCEFLDPGSGLGVSRLQDATVEVDARGCIHLIAPSQPSPAVSSPSL